MDDETIKSVSDTPRTKGSHKSLDVSLSDRPSVKRGYECPRTFLYSSLRSFRHVTYKKCVVLRCYFAPSYSTCSPEMTHLRP